MAEGKSSWSFRMRQLPKAEYRLMKMLIEKYAIDDPSEMFVVSLRMMYEVMHYDEPTGQKWVQNVINNWRANKNETREYEV